MNQDCSLQFNEELYTGEFFLIPILFLGKFLLTTFTSTDIILDVKCIHKAFLSA